MNTFQNIPASILSSLNFFHFVVFSILTFVFIFFLLEYRDINNQYKQPYLFAVLILFTMLIYSFVLFVDDYMDHKSYIKLHVLSMLITNVLGCGILYHFLGSLGLPFGNLWVVLVVTFLYSLLSVLKAFSMVDYNALQIFIAQLILMVVSVFIVVHRLQQWYTVSSRTDGAMLMFIPIFLTFCLVVFEFFFLNFAQLAPLYLFAIISYGIRFVPLCFVYASYKYASVCNKVNR